MTYTREETAMQAWTDAQVSLIRARMQERESEATAARLAAEGMRARTGVGLRGTVGRALIQAGQALAPEAVVTHTHHRRVAARQP
jgi:hypothetical protein